ncbi:MAG: hypothetical protein ACOYLK_17635 [Sphingomonas sp.]
MGFTEAKAARLTQACSLRGVNRTQLICNAVNDYINRGNNAATPENPKRVAMLCEFTQVALDILICEQVPERREEVPATVQDRIERFYS